MAIVNTKTTLANLALMLLGETPVNDIESSALTTAGKIIAAQYDICRQQILQENAWRFATKRTQLNATGNAPAFTWTAQYLLPPDCLTLIQVGTDDMPFLVNNEYMVEGNAILTTSTGPLPIKYIADIEDVAQYPASFKTALSQLLAAMCAAPILKSHEKAAELLQLYQDTLILAKSNNAIENAPRIIDRSKWREAQFNLNIRRDSIY